MLTDRQFTIIVAVVSAVVSAVVAWWVSQYYYKVSQATKIPTFAIEPLRVKLVDITSSAGSNVAFQYKGHSIRQKAVNAILVYFWNDGNTPIAKTEIRDPLTIIISGDSEILEPKILKASPFTGITFDTQDEKRNSAIINFELLESNDGAALQIIYAGPSDAKLDFHGTMIGAPNVTTKELSGYSQFNNLLPAKSKNSDLVVYLFLLLVVILSVSMTIPFVRNFLYNKGYNKSNKTAFLLYSTMSYGFRLINSG